MNKLKPFYLHSAKLDNYADINQQLLEGLDLYINDETTRKSHEFFGRYENIYISSEKIPTISSILHAAKKFSAEILNCSDSDLKAGLWFNVMNPGDKTTMHKHDDDDELLSAVYYVKVAENSGMLHLEKSPINALVTPEEGMFVFFPPNMPHDVTENLSGQSRVSLGINIGPVNPDDFDD